MPTLPDWSIVISNRQRGHAGATRVGKHDLHTMINERLDEDIGTGHQLRVGRSFDCFFHELAPYSAAVGPARPAVHGGGQSVSLARRISSGTGLRPRPLPKPVE